MRRRWVRCALLVAAVGCFDAPSPVCAFVCGDADECPDGYQCVDDVDDSRPSWCIREDRSSEGTVVCETANAEGS